jgi:hypothetical protein
MIKDLIEIAQEAKTHLLSLEDRGSKVCNEFRADPNLNYFCIHCNYSQYTHLCKRILAIGFEYK